MNNVGKSQIAFCAYSRYLDLVESRCSGADVRVATFSAWLGQEASICSSVCMRALLDSGVDPVSLVDTVGSSQGNASNHGRDAETAQENVDCSAGDCSKDNTRVSSARPLSAVGNAGDKGPNWARNRVWASERKARKARRKEAAKSAAGGVQATGSGAQVRDSDVLSESVREKWCAQNALETERARRALIAMKSLPIEDQIRCNRVKMQAAVERNMVSIEKMHSTLAATGNVPGDMTGFAATIVGSGSISPNSSASEAEFRKCQKALLDSDKALRDSEEHKQRMIEVIVAAGLSVPENPRDERDLNHADGIWTVNTENEKIIDDTYSNYGVMHDYLGTGKMRIIPV